MIDLKLTGMLVPLLPTCVVTHLYVLATDMQAWGDPRLSLYAAPHHQPWDSNWRSLGFARDYLYAQNAVEVKT